MRKNDTHRPKLNTSALYRIGVSENLNGFNENAHAYATHLRIITILVI